jgi:UDP-N-acetylmuramoyl-tripeptide--D-alanyl-D-alanine ligase
MRFRIREVADAVGGRLVGPDVEVVGAGIDSRDLVGGQLFVPVIDARDGHEFIGAAIDRGAAAYLTSRTGESPASRSEGRDALVAAVEVADTLAALADLGRLARRRLGGTDAATDAAVIGVTGSVGKTTTKDLLAAVLGTTKRVSASVRSFNNELGVPLTLANASDDAEAVVVEMGARGPGHIAELCSIAVPTVGVVTTVETVHTEMFGGLDEVAAAKGELVESLPTSGTAVLNVDNALVAAMAERTSARVIRVGLASPAADVSAAAIVVGDDLRPAFRLRTPAGEIDVRLGVRGRHNVLNALLAVATGLAVGVDLADVASGLASATASPWRMELTTAPSGARVLNDAYNAGPASTAAAVRALADIEARRRIALLGVMAELGADGPALHLEVSELAAGLGIEVVAIDAPDYGDRATHVADVDAALARVLADGPLDADVAVLVKGSRVAGLERLAQALVAPE